MRRIALLSTVITLCSCVTSNQQAVHSQYMQAANVEQAAWDRAQAQSDSACGSYDDKNPLPRNKAMEVIECYEKNVREIVEPVAVNSIALNAYIITIKEISLSYKKGKVDREEAALNAEKAWLSYVNFIGNQYTQSMQQAQNADMITAQKQQAFFQSLQQAANNMEANRRYEEQMDLLRTQAIINAQQTNKTYHTNCYQYGNNVNCTTR